MLSQASHILSPTCCLGKFRGLKGGVCIGHSCSTVVAIDVEIIGSVVEV